MTNWTELKRLAEEAGSSGWDADKLSVTSDTRALVCCGRAYLECCGDAEVAGDEFDPVCSATSENFAAFIAAANPKTILALIAENERLREGVKGDYDLDSWLEFTHERDQLCAEVEALREIAVSANNNCKSALLALSKHRPQLADEFMIYCKNIDADLSKRK